MAEQPTVSAPDPDAAISVRDLVRDYRRPRTSLRGPAPAVHALRGVSFDVGQGRALRHRRGVRLRQVDPAADHRRARPRHLRDRRWSTARDITGLPERRLRFLREHLQLVFQDPMGSLDPRMRVRDIVAEPLVAQGTATTGSGSPSCWRRSG